MNRTACKRLQQFLIDHGLERIFLYRPENFAWLTGGGDSTVVTGEGVGYLEVTPGAVRLHTSCVEAVRLAREEKADFTSITYQWYSSPPIDHPNDLEHDLTALRLVMSPDEQDRFRVLGREAARALGDAMRTAAPGWSEAELAGEIARAMYRNRIQPIVLLVAGEERIREYRHPLPKHNRLGRLAMGVVCGRRDGLVINLTRMRAWDSTDILTQYELLLQVEKRALSATVPGATVGDVMAVIADGYREIGYPDAFFGHHQGGIAGYRPREILGKPGDETTLAEGMCVAWNPSLPGVKVEDTFLITSTGLENLTLDPDWPMVEIDGQLRPGILVE